MFIDNYDIYIYTWHHDLLQLISLQRRAYTKAGQPDWSSFRLSIFSTRPWMASSEGCSSKSTSKAHQVAQR